MLNLQLSVTYPQPTVKGQVAFGISAEVDGTEAQTVTNRALCIHAVHIFEFRVAAPLFAKHIPV